MMNEEPDRFKKKINEAENKTKSDKKNAPWNNFASEHTIVSW
jgi:hypothetical protein